VAGGRWRAPAFAMPAGARLLGPIDLWSEDLPEPRPSVRRQRSRLPAELVRGLIGWSGDPTAVVDALVWCRRRPTAVRAVFRSPSGWRSFLDGLGQVLNERSVEAGPAPPLDLREVAGLYQMIYWIGRTAAFPTPPSDVLHATVAGWAAVPAVVHRALHGTPLLLTEHGLYVRESYLLGVQRDAAPATHFLATRLARGLVRLAYASADCVAPVTHVHAHWEEHLGVRRERIHVIANGVPAAPQITPPPRDLTVVSVGRIDPLKDVHLLLRVAGEVLRRLPGARFLHYGPVPEGREAYGESCRRLHARLELGDRFRFMGPTTDPSGAVRGADVVLMTSISEGMPMSVLEAMAEARPVVSTWVGGVPDVLNGCGLTAPPGDLHGLATAVCTLLKDPELAGRLGTRGYEVVTTRFPYDGYLQRYQEVLSGLAQVGGAR
jgi:glycosyltransferase involved in cell wall biosynthesis